MTSKAKEASRKSIVNNFTIEAATVNGSGSQTSNLILTKALFRMGIPVGPKNVFPSNIAGLPTWYLLRLNPQGYLSRKRALDVLVALNPMTFAQDVIRVAPAGVVIHESEFPLTGTAKREDVIYYPIPFATLAAQKITEFKLKKPLTNMIYVGVLGELLGIEEAAIEMAIRHQLQGKEKAIAVNLHAVDIGRQYVRENIKKRDSYRVERMNGTAGKILIEGNMACALGALFAGCTVASWYPITPASSLTETLIDLLDEFRKDPSTGRKKYAVVQAEDEIAAIGMALGAGWAGARAMTATSGPGISLMAEFVGYGYYAEIPVVIFDIQRIGPSTGLPTRTSQGDFLFAATLSHGDTKHPMLIPSNVHECFEFSMTAFDLAERLQTPVFVMSDLDLGMNLWLTDPFEYPQAPYDRGKVLTEKDLAKLKLFERYRDTDGDGICYRSYPGNPHPLAAYFTRGSGHNEAAQYTEDGMVYQRVMERLAKKFETARRYMPRPIVDYVTGAKVGIIAYGSSDHAMAEARDILASQGIKTNYLKIRAYPFFMPTIKEFFEKCSKVFMVEQNRDSQMAQLLHLELDGNLAAKMRPALHFSGFPIPAEAIVSSVSEKAPEFKETAPIIEAGGE